MAAPPSKRYCSSHSLEARRETAESETASTSASTVIFKSSGDKLRPDYMFLSDDDDAKSTCTDLELGDCYVYPSKDSNQLLITDPDVDEDMDDGEGDCYIYPSEESNQLQASDDADGTMTEQKIATFIHRKSLIKKI